jgi:glycosyltransferase involved in cell wall biosynthesis
MISELSILIPTYNSKCISLVEKLAQLCSCIPELKYEIIVADDGSRDQVAIISNLLINELEHCHYIRRKENVGRAKIRNFLADQAQYEWLLFLDSDVKIVSDDFIRNYLNPQADVVSGRTKIFPSHDKKNLRSKYETKWATCHSADKLNENPYEHFVTANFICRSKVFDVCRFDERFLQYGYEDTAFGISLKENGFTLQHIYNPVGFDKFDSNSSYLQKVEVSLHTLYRFRDELRGYSQVQKVVEYAAGHHILWLLRLWHCLFGRLIRYVLEKYYPSLLLFNIYKVGYYATIKFD